MQIDNIFQKFVGKQEQFPPMYSAIKVKGKKLYEYARSGQTVEIEPRKIEIYSIKIKKIIENEIDFEVSCSKGTYIRSLCEDIASKLGTVGYMKELNRIQVGKFSIKDAITISQLQESNIQFLEQHIITIEEFFKDKPVIKLKESEIRPFINGVKIQRNIKDGIYNIYINEEYIGIAIAEKSKIKRELLVEKQVKSNNILKL